MTVSTLLNKITYTANGVTNIFSFTFAVEANGSADIQVFLTDTSGNVTQLAQPSQFTVTLNSAVAPNPTPVGGSVNIISTPANGVLVTILRTMSLIQPTSLANQGTLYQPVVESMDDNQTMQLQQLNELLGRQIAVSVSDPAPAALPPVAQRKNLGAAFDSNGNMIAAAIPASGVISSAMQPFVSAVSISAAKALLGYGTMANENIGAAGKGIIDDGSGNARVNQIVTAVATNQSPAAAQHMTNYVSSGTNIFTLPKLTTVFNGYELWIFCITNTATLSPNAADNFPSLGGGVGIVLRTGYFARLIGDGVSAWQVTQGRIPSMTFTTQTKQVFTSGIAATYTTPAGCTRIEVRECGAGGGGGSPSSGGGAGGAGGTTTFNAISAAGGGGGTAGSGGGGASSGGPGGTGGAGVASFRAVGNVGQNGPGATAIITLIGGAGGAGAINGFGAGGVGASIGLGGGAGGAGAGGGGGEYVEIIINNPAATYTYTVGIGGTAGTSAAAGNGGVIIVDEYYN